MIMCHHRSRVAQDVLGIQEFEMERNFTWKFLNHFRSDIEHAAATGLFSQIAADFLEEVAMMGSVDTQEIEGLNNSIKRIGLLAPHMSWELLASRVIIKKRAVDFKGYARARWLCEALRGQPRIGHGAIEERC